MTNAAACALRVLLSRLPRLAILVGGAVSAATSLTIDDGTGIRRQDR